MLAKIAVAAVALSLLASACQKVELKREVPGSPAASYEELPR